MTWPAPTFLNVEFNDEHELCFEWCIGDERITLYATPSLVIRSNSTAGQVADEEAATMGETLKTWLREVTQQASEGQDGGTDK